MAENKIVCLPHCGYLSETSRMLAVYNALRRTDADVTMATHGGLHEHILREQPVPFDLLAPTLSDERSRTLVADGVGIGSPKQSMWTDDEIRAAALAEADYFRAVGASAVVTGFQLTTLLSARMAGIPLITSHAGSWVAPVLQRGLVAAPMRTVPKGINRLPAPIQRYLANRGALHYPGWTKGFNRVARELGVERIPSLPALLSGDLTLVTEAPELLEMTHTDFDTWRAGRGMRRGARIRAIGPLFAQLPIPVPDAVQEFLAVDDDVAYVAVTSTSASVVSRVTAAVRAAGLRALVATTVHGVNVLHDPGVLQVPFLPSHLVMPRVRVAVVTGGQGSVQTALAAGTPLVGIPLQPEQEWNVSVAERAGAGRAVFLPDIDRLLTGTVQDVAGDVTAKVSAERVARIYARYDGPAEAARAVRSYLGEPVAVAS